MKIKNSQIILVITTFLGVYILLAGYLSITKPIDVGEKIEEENKVVSQIIEETTQTPPIAPKAEPDKSNKIEPEITQIESKALSEEVNKIAISMQVLDNNYELEINENSSIFEMMKKLQDEKENEFSFKYKEYPGMGVFIYEINGIKGKRGAYWIYYVNEKEASVGVSNYTLSEGDSILWKQE